MDGWIDGIPDRTTRYGQLFLYVVGMGGIAGSVFFSRVDTYECSS